MNSLKLKLCIKKFFRYIFISIGVLVFFTFFIFVCLRISFLENIIKDFSVTNLNNILSSYNLQVSVEDLELNLPFSIRIENVKILDKEGEFAKVESLTINSRFWALLRYKVVIPSIDLNYLSLSRVPHIILPEQPKEESPKKTIKEQFDFIHTILFNSSLPSIYLSKIAINHATINPAVLHSLQKEKKNQFEEEQEPINISEENAKKLLSNYFTKPIILDGVWNAGLEKDLFRFFGELAIKNEDKQAVLKNSIDILATKDFRFGLNFNDDNGLTFAIIKEIGQLPQSKKAFIDFQLNTVGNIDTYEIKATGKVFDTSYLVEPAKLDMFYSSKPFKGNIKFIAKPSIPHLINKGKLSFLAELDTHSISNEGKKIKDVAESEVHHNDITKEQANVPKEQVNVIDNNTQKTEEQKIVKKEVPNKNVGFSYKILFDNVEYVPENLQAFLGEKQEIKGTLNVQFFTRKLPKIIARNVEITAKHLSSKTAVTISRNIDVHSDFIIDSFSFLDTEKETYTGKLTGKFLASGKLENPKFSLSAIIPEFNLIKYKYKRDKRDNINGRYLYLENADLTLETTGFEKKENVIPLDKAALAELYRKNPYAAPVKRMKELFHSAVNYPVKMNYSVNADYMGEKLYINSKIRMAPSILGIGNHKEKFIEFSDINIKLFDFGSAGKLRFDFAQNENEHFHISGKLQGNMENTEKITKLFALPLSLEKFDYSLAFSEKKTKKQDVFINISAKTGKFEENSWNNFLTKVSITDIWNNGAIDSAISFDDLELTDIGLVKNWKLTLKGLFQKMLLAMQFDGDAVFGMNAELSTNFELLNIKLSKFDFVYPYKKTHIKLIKKAECFFAPNDINFKNLRFSVAPKGEASINGRVTQNMLDLKGWLKEIDLAYLPKDFKGLLDGQFKVSGATTKPSGLLEARLRDFSTLSSPKVSLVVKGKILEVKDEHKLNLDIKMIDKEKYQVEEAFAHLQIPLKYKPMLSLSHIRPLQGKIVYKGSLKTLWGYVPLDGRRVTGNFDLLANISGSLARPNISLKANTQNARFEDLLLGVLLTDLNFNVDFQKGHGDIMLSAKDGRKGDFSLSGNFDVPFLYHGKYKPVYEKVKDKAKNLWKEKQIQRSLLVLDMQTVFHNFSPFYRNDFSATLSGQTIIKENIESLKMIGEINVDKGEVHLENIRSSSIPTLTIVEDSTKRVRKRKAGQNGNLAININIDRNFGVYAPGIETLWKGNLQVNGKIQEPSVTGTLIAWKGKMNLVGTELVLNKGEVSFDGSTPIVPTLNLVLEHNSAGVQSFITLKGMALKPTLEMTSNPYLPSDEVLAHILFSRSVSELSDFEKIRLAGVLTSLVGFNISSGITGATKNFLGVDVLEVNSQESADGEEEISVEIGKYIKNNFYIGIEQGLGQQNTSGVLKYEVNENLSVGTKAGTEETEVGFKWRFDY